LKYVGENLRSLKIEQKRQAVHLKAFWLIAWGGGGGRNYGENRNKFLVRHIFPPEIEPLTRW